MTDAAPIGHNEPPEPLDQAFEDIKQRAEELRETANKWLTQRPTIEDKETAEKASAFIDQLQANIKAAEAARKEANEPYRKLVEINNARYKAIQATMEKARDLLRDKLAPWLKKEQQRIAEEQQRAAAEAEAKRQAAEEAARKAAEEEAKGDVIGNAVAAEEAAKEARKAEQAAARAQRQTASARPSVGSGRAKTFRKRTVVTITNRELIPASVFRKVDDDAVLKVLRADLDLAKKTPGVKVEVVEQVV